MVRLYHLSRNPGEIFARRQNSAFKNHPTDILRDKNHLYGIVLVHIVHKTALNTVQQNAYRWPDINFLKIAKTQILASLPHSLTTVASLEPKRSSTRPPFYATITNSPVGCAFWGSDECVLSVPCLFFYLQSGYLSSSSSNETILRC